MSAVLEVQGLTTRFATPDGEVLAADSVGFTIDEGESLGVVGESGSGKTQVFLSIMGLLAKNGRSTGSAKYRGTEILNLTARRLNWIRGDEVAMIFQDPMTSLNPYLSIARQMTEVLREHKGIFGGELAGHYYFRDNYHADCSIAAVFEILNLLRSTGKKMSEITAPLMRYAKTPEINFEVEDKAAKMRELAEVYSAGEIDWLDGITVNFPDWWFNVRPSNTEPLLRLVVEARTPADLERRFAELVARIGHPVDH